MHHFVAIGEFKLELQSGNGQFGSNSTIFRAVWPWNLTDDLQQGKSEGFESCDRPIVRKRPIWVKIGDVLSRVTLKFDGWPWKTIGHLSFAVSSFVQHFIAIGEFKLEFQSGNAQFGSNWTIFRAVWPWNLTDDLQQGKSEGFDSCDWPSNLKLDSNCQFFHPCDREIWWMTSKNNRALLLYYVKLCASFHTHWWIQTGFAVQKRSIRVEIGDMLSHVTLKFDRWPWKTIGHLFYATSSFVQHFVAIGEFKLELESGNAQSGSNLSIFSAVWPWNLTDDLQIQ